MNILQRPVKKSHLILFSILIIIVLVIVVVLLSRNNAVVAQDPQVGEVDELVREDTADSIAAQTAPTAQDNSIQAQPSESLLPLPSSMPLDEYESLLFDFLESMAYQDLDWAADKRVRDTGAYIDQTYYGTHPAVRIFYSPEVYDWLKNGREGDIPDGAMIIKEMFTPPAARYADFDDDAINDELAMWTFIVRDRAGSKDGWFWGYHGTGGAVDSSDYPFDYPNAGFGQYCVRCHASAENLFTFSALRNIAGEAGDPVSYRVDDSWRPAEDAAEDPGQTHDDLADGPDASVVAGSKPGRDIDPEFVALFDSIVPVAPADVVAIPPLTYDHVIAGPDGPGQFLTSDQCLSCHDGQTLPFGPNMIIPASEDQELINLSPYGEWNWSMMGLAGRDPIFFAQLESEISTHDSGDLPGTIQNLCFRCHGVMGQRQFHLDDAGEFFTQDIIQVTDPDDPNHKYAALARDGISCTVCHQIIDEGKPLQETFTGQFDISAPGADEPGISNIYGPFEDPITLPMESSLGLKPVYSEFTKSSELCGSCHTIYLPIFDAQGNQVGSDFEQSTYLEWQNSAYENEFGVGEDPKTCQDCHMTGDYHGQDLDFRIANIQDQTYPESDHRAPEAEITVPIREDFRRHTLLGINIFGLEMFNQFDDVLGVRKTSFMTGSDNGLPTAIAESNRLAKEETAVVEIENVAYEDGRLTAEVKVTNLTGHRLPSGVGFRRAFLEFEVRDQHNLVLWASGRTNDLGVIVDGSGTPLPSEFLTLLNPEACEADPEQCEQAYEPHYETITGEDQVQIYQELVKNPENLFTTSFVAQETTVKDNRLLPKGWRPLGPPGFADDPVWGPRFLLATTPKGNVVDDAAFLDGTGSDTITYQVDLPPEALQGGTVSATLYYQSIPPFYLMDRFTTADGPNAQRLHYIASHLNLKDTPIEQWKLAVGSATSDISTE